MWLNLSLIQSESTSIKNRFFSSVKNFWIQPIFCHKNISQVFSKFHIFRDIFHAFFLFCFIIILLISIIFFGVYFVFWHLFFSGSSNHALIGSFWNLIFFFNYYFFFRNFWEKLWKIRKIGKVDFHVFDVRREIV